MKNTEKNYIISSKKRLKKIGIGSGILISGLLISMTNAYGRELTQDNNKAIETFLESCDQKEKITYMDVYSGVLKEIDIEQFDQGFINFYNNAENLIIEDTIYRIDSLSARHVIGNGTKLIYGEQYDFDLINNETYKDYCDLIMPLKDANFFYQMYLDGKIEENNIYLTEEELIKYTNNWNGKRHTESPETIATNKTSDYFNKKIK